MGLLKFKTSEVKRVVAHTLSSTNWDMPYSDEAPKPAMLLVHDQGVYIMSNARPRDMVDDKSAFCAYANGCDPRKDEDFYEESRVRVGGDDFAEILPVTPNTLQLCDEWKEMHIRVNAKSISIAFKKPKK